MRRILKHTERLHISLRIYTDGFPLICELVVSQMSSLTHSLYYRNCFSNKSQNLTRLHVHIAYSANTKACNSNKPADICTCTDSHLSSFSLPDTQWFCQHGKSIGRQTKLSMAENRLIMVVLECSTMAGFHCRHSMLPTCVCNMCLCVVHTGKST